MNIEQVRNNIRNKLTQKKRNIEEASKRRNSRWNRYYQSRQWKQLRQWKITNFPICEMHAKYGIIIPATSIHHKKPFGLGQTEYEKWQLLLDPSNLISCCESCHDEFHRQLKAQHKTYIKEIIPTELQVD